MDKSFKDGKFDSKHQIKAIKTLSFDTTVGEEQDSNKNLQIPFELDPTYKQIYIIDKDDFYKRKNSLDGYFQRIPPIIKRNNTSDKNILDYEVWTPRKVGTPKIKELVTKIIEGKKDAKKYRYKRVGKTNKFEIIKPPIMTIPTDEDGLPIIISTDNKTMLGVPAISTSIGMSAGKKIRKHKGIIQIGGNKGRLRKGYRYSGKKLKSGLPEIIKCKSKKC